MFTLLRLKKKNALNKIPDKNMNYIYFILKRAQGMHGLCAGMKIAPNSNVTLPHTF